MRIQKYSRHSIQKIKAFHELEVFLHSSGLLFTNIKVKGSSLNSHLNPFTQLRFLSLTLSFSLEQ